LPSSSADFRLAPQPGFRGCRLSGLGEERSVQLRDDNPPPEL